MDIGGSFPQFFLMDENGEMLDSRHLEGIRFVILGLPSDEGSLDEFASIYVKLIMRNVPTFCVSSATPAELRTIKDSTGIKMKFLSDPDGTLSLLKGSAFLVGKDGKVEAASGNTAGCARKILDAAICRYKGCC